MTANEGLTVGAVARLAGVTVRTLHHYDEIGLVVPERRAESGYRIYERSEVERLQEVLFFRELGFGLEEIKRIVTQPAYDRQVALERQKALLKARAEHLLMMVDAVTTAAQAQKRGINMSTEEMLEVFGDFDPTQHQQEAEERWGDTAAYQQSAARTSRYTKQDWQRLKQETEAINQRLLDLMEVGAAPESSAAMEIAEAHRAHITKWFYDCSRTNHSGLGQMYVADHRFKENIDKAGEGLAEYLSAAIAANALR
ncbi:MAG: MerR family transcriptional regulator [Actinomycetota bacterium]|nr:MerR family transcriptional regulator [Actinomycetota bacterium]